MEFSRQEYWSELPCPSPGDLPDPGIEPGSPVLQVNSLPTEPTGKPNRLLNFVKYFSVSVEMIIFFSLYSIVVVIVQLLSHVWLFTTPWTIAHQASLSFTIPQSLLKLMPIESVMPSNHLILCHPLLFLPSIFPSIRVFSSKLALHIRWWKYWSFSFSINPSNQYSGLTSFRTDWFDFLAVQGTLRQLLQCHSSKALILQFSAFFMIQLSHPYMITGKTIVLAI